ncbi:DUF2256 domain-containing protein [Microbulbifer aestuariivivens]|uniref:DUF2256 domain-containing protein n=1 Tax=Microbulbifer aestuariivivens TaxID=1908308 RepID=UPI0031F00D09
MAHRKAQLPEKICPACGRPFLWRKKWALNWNTVTYCSERCRRQRGVATNQATSKTTTKATTKATTETKPRTETGAAPARIPDNGKA